MSLSIAVLGCGAIAPTHVAAIRRAGTGARFAFASRDPSRAGEYCKRFRGFASYGDYASALADSRVDVALITTPPRNHQELALAALAAGKQVVVEKPAFLSVAELDLVERAAQSARRQVLVAENYAYKPVTLALRRLLDAGAIGSPRLIRLSALKTQAVPPADWRSGAGALFEGGVHWVNLLLALGGEAASVQGFRPNPGEPERTMVVVVRFAGGAVGTLHHSWETPVRLKGLSLSQILGDRGTIVFESNGLFVRLNGTRRRFLLPGFRDIKGFRAMWRDFLTALETGSVPRMTLAAARRDLAVVEAAYRTATPG